MTSRITQAWRSARHKRSNRRYALDDFLRAAVAEHARRQGLWPAEALSDLVVTGLATMYGAPEAHRMIAPLRGAREETPNA
jgi:hypothetical protein